MSAAMIEPPKIVRSARQLAARIHLTIPKSEIQRVMGPGLQEVHAALAAQGVAPAGPWFTHHRRIEPHAWDFEIGVPVARPIAAHGRVQPCERPATIVARAMYRGGYEGLGAAWGELDAWIAAQKLAARADLWEVYALGPESGPDSAGWRTELNRPLSGA
jgi:effector-binding domain-containing protein